MIKRISTYDLTFYMILPQYFFSNTFSRIKEKSRYRWLKLQEDFLVEYSLKGIVPIHLILIAIPFLIIHSIIYGVSRCKYNKEFITGLYNSNCIFL